MAQLSSGQGVPIGRSPGGWVRLSDSSDRLDMVLYSNQGLQPAADDLLSNSLKVLTFPHHSLTNRVPSGSISQSEVWLAKKKLENIQQSIRISTFDWVKNP